MNRRTRWPMTATRGTHTLHGPFHLEYPSAAKSMGGVVDSGTASSAPQAGRGGTLGLTYRLSPRSFTSTSNNNSFGATVGLGVEWAFANNWSARAEWDAILLQNQSFTVSGSAFGTDTITVNNRSINLFTAALNYKFGGWGY